MARAEVGPQGHGDTKEGARHLALGVAAGAARGFAAEIKRQRSDFIPPSSEPISGLQPRKRIGRATRNGAAFVKYVGIVDLTRATLIGAAQGAAVAGVAEAGRKVSKSPRQA